MNRRASGLGALLALVGLAALLALPVVPGVSAGSSVAPAPLAAQQRSTPPAFASAALSEPQLAGQYPTAEGFTPAWAGTAGEFAVSAPNGSSRMAGVPAPTTTPPPAVPLLAAGPLGSVTGQVIDISTAKPIGGATVSVQPATGSCTGAVCVNVRTNTAGFFNATASAGLDTVAVSDPLYLTNTSVEELTTGSKLDMGRIYLAHYGQVNGTIIGDDPLGEPVAKVNISWSLRLLPSVLGYGPVSTTTGTFSVWVPPAPVKLRFSPPLGYEGNWTYVDLAPYATVVLPPVRLIPGVTVVATLADSVLRQPINGTLYGAISFCSRLNGFCFPQGPAANLASSGGTLSALAPPGPVAATVLAQGYVQNLTTTVDVPRGGPGTVVDAGTIYLVPGGVVQLSTNMTFGNPSKKSAWGTGNVLITACTLDGELMGSLSTVNGKTNLTASTCLAKTVPFASTQRLTVAPLRNSLTVHASWSMPTGFPAFDNTTWINATPDHLLLLSSLDLLPGGYIQANVTFQGGGFPTGFLATACSVEEPSVCGTSVGPWWGYGSYNCGLHTFATYYFCAPAPPGPDMVTVTSQGYVTSQTWVTVPSNCCLKTQMPVLAANVTMAVASSGTGGPTDFVSGRVFIAVAPGGPAVPVGGAVVTACSASDTEATCGRTTANAYGNFTVGAPPGWDSLSALANGFAQNTVWVDVGPAGNSSVAVYLQALATLSGFVYDEGGAPVGGASVVACPVGAVRACAPIGSGTTQLSGQFAGTVTPGAFPWGTVIVTASAPGYLPDSEWLNVTHAGLIHLPALVLEPPSLGNGSTSGAGPSWVDGRLVQARTGSGLSQATVTACPVLGQFACISFPDGTATGGEFNGSLPGGLYRVTFSATSFVSKTITIAPAGGSPLHLGIIALVPYIHILGRVAVDPWRSMTLQLGNLRLPPGSQSTFGLGPGGVIVAACGAGQGCGPAIAADSGGLFNVSAPPNGTITITATPTISAFGTAPGGFVGNSTRTTVSNRSVTLGRNQTLGLAIFGGVSGSAVDAASFNVTLDSYERNVGYGTVTATYPSGSSAIVTAGAMGVYTLFLPPGPPPSLVVSGGAYMNQVPWFPLPTVQAGSVTFVGQVALPHYGYITLTAVDSSMSAIGQATVRVTTPDPANATSTITTAQTTPTGTVNLTAAPGRSVIVNVSAPGLFASVTNLTVEPSQTTALGAVSMTAPIAPPISWVRTAELSDPGGPVSNVVVDGDTGLAVPGAVVTAYNPQGGASPAGALSNRVGEFLISAPPGAPDSLLIGRVGFVTNATPVTVTLGNASVVGPVNLTADGVVAGTVIGRPGAAVIDDAFVVVCPISLAVCGNTVYTNHSGSFWSAVAPGWARITVGATGYTNNTTYVKVCSDCFFELPTIGLEQYGTVAGTILGLPANQSLSALVSLCPANATGLPCPYQVPTPPDGRFAVSAPAGTSVLAATSPGFDPSTLVVSLAAGQRIDIGNITLWANGTLDGTVVDAATQAPVALAQVAVCRPARCAPSALTGTDGSFTLDAGPGEWLFSITAAGYIPLEQNVSVPSAGVVSLGSLAVVPASPNGTYAVSGTVQASGLGQFAGAAVSVRIASILAAATASGPDGGFELWVPRGSFTIVANAPGWTGAAQPLTVVGPQSGLVLELFPFGYPVRGEVTDALTGAPLPDARVSEGSVTLGTTDASGVYAVELGNGSHTLVFSAPVGSAVPYSPVQVSLSVVAAPVYRSVGLLPPMVRLGVLVRDRQTGLAVPGATAELSGSAIDDAAVQLSAASGPAGPAALVVPIGAYVVRASAPAHQPAERLLALNASAANLSVTFLLNSTAPGPVAAGPWAPVLAVVGAAAVAALAVLAWRRRRRNLWSPSQHTPVPIDAAVEARQPGVEGTEELDGLDPALHGSEQ